MSARALSIEIVYFHGDDITESKWEHEFEIPAWVYRPRCWIKGHKVGLDRCCVFCHHIPTATPIEGSADVR